MEILPGAFLRAGRGTLGLGNDEGRAAVGELRLSDIARASGTQFGAFLFLTTFVFRPEVLTPYQSGDALALGPLPSALATIACMAVAGVACIAVAAHPSRRLERALAICGCAVPLLALALLLVRAPLVPPLVSALCGSACVVQAFGFARANTFGFGATLLSVGLCLAVAAVVSEMSYRLFPLHLYGTMAVAAVMAATGAVLFAASRQAACSPFDEDASARTDAGRALAAAAPALWEGMFCAASLGLTWNAADFPGTRGHEAFFVIGALAAVLAWLGLWLAWRRIRRADVVVYAAALPALLSLILYVFSEGATLPLYFACAVASELFLLALLWTSALAVDRSLRHPGLVACVYLVVFAALFGFFMVIQAAVPTFVVRKVMPLLALVFLAYLIGYGAFRDRRAVMMAEAEGEDDAAAPAPADFARVLDERCAAVAREWGLSAREGELLPLFVMGMSATEIGSRLFIAPQTVKTHRYRIYRKANVGSHAELVELVSQSAPPSESTQ